MTVKKLKEYLDLATDDAVVSIKYNEADPYSDNNIVVKAKALGIEINDKEFCLSGAV